MRPCAARCADLSHATNPRISSARKSRGRGEAQNRGQPRGVNTEAANYGFDPYSAALAPGEVGWFGSKAIRKAKKVLRNASREVKKVARVVTPAVNAAWPMVRQALQSTPYGMAAAAGFEAMSAGIRGGNLRDIAEAAARGAIPNQIQAALHFASDVVRGKNVARALLSNAANAFQPGSPEAQAFGMASQILGSAAPSLGALASARRGLSSEGARRAFDTAVGTVAKAAGNTGALTRFSAVPPHVLRAVGRAKPSRLNFAPLSPRAAALVAHHVRGVSVAALSGRADTAGLESNATIYVVENGDSPWAIAKKLMNEGNRWRELVAANPQKKRVESGPNKGSFATLWAGEKLKLPVSWTAKHAPVITADAMAQARALLKLWSTTDGSKQAGVTDYGLKSEDLSTVWGPRDRLEMMSFANWWNNQKSAKLAVTGDLNDANADALRRWAAEHAATPNAPIPSPSIPSVPVPLPLPLPLPAPVVPVMPVAPAIPAAPSVPVGVLPQDVIALMVAAKGPGITPAQVRAIAVELRAKGYAAQADDLLAYAAKLETAQGGGAVPAPVAPSAKPETSDNGALLLLGGAAVLAKVAHLW